MAVPGVGDLIRDRQLEAGMPTSGEKNIQDLSDEECIGLMDLIYVVVCRGVSSDGIILVWMDLANICQNLMCN